jgi:predicted ATP-grasp superfamily ATP-dependent carboligase
VLGGEYRGLGVVRSLGRRGLPVWVVREPEGDGIATHSRYASRSLSWPAESDEARISFLRSFAREAPGWALIPTGDETAAFLARHRDALAQDFLVTTPPWVVLRWAYDKRLMHKLAQSLGIAAPRTWFPKGRDEVASLDCEFPAILKPAIKEGHNSFTAAKAWRVEDREELLRRYDEACTYVDPEVVMVQELVLGGGGSQVSYAALMQDGEERAWLTALRLRQNPMDFGRSSSFVVSASEPDAAEASRALLREIRFTGLVEVEFKRDPRDGVVKLLDVNPRVWGWHTLGGRAGVDFPYLLVRMLRGEQVGLHRGRPGVRWVRAATDNPVCLREIAAGRLGLGDVLRSRRRGIEHAVFASDDPLPGLLEGPLLARLALSRIRRGEKV